MGSEAIANEAKGQMGYCFRGRKGERIIIRACCVNKKNICFQAQKKSILS